MKLLGLLLIANALILSAAWMVGETASKAGSATRIGVVSVTLIAVFAGIFFIIADRSTEITVKGVGTIKAAALSAQTDAKEVAAIKQRVENQSATIDLIASKATQAQSLAEQVKRTLDFAVTVQKALADDRVAFNHLQDYVRDESELSPIAGNMYVAVRTNATSPIRPGFLNLPNDHPLYAATTRTDIRKFYSQLPPVLRPAGIIFELEKNPKIDETDKLALCLDILSNDPSLQATNIAGSFAAKATGVDWNPFIVQPVIDKIKEKLESQ
jgi:hypothetical protein